MFSSRDARPSSGEERSLEPVAFTGLHAPEDPFARVSVPSRSEIGESKVITGPQESAPRSESPSARTGPRLLASTISEIWGNLGSIAREMGLSRTEMFFYGTAVTLGAVVVPAMIVSSAISEGAAQLNRLDSVALLGSALIWAFCEASAAIANRYSEDGTASQEVRLMGRAIAPLGFIGTVGTEFLQSLGDTLQLTRDMIRYPEVGAGVTQHVAQVAEHLSNYYIYPVLALGAAWATVRYVSAQLRKD